MLALVLVVAGLVVPGAPARAAVPSYSNADIGFEESIYQPVDPGPRLDREKDYAGTARTPMIRVDLDWNWLEHAQNCPGPCTTGLDWSGIDTTVDAAYQRGLRVLMILDYAPPWANGGHTGGFFPTREHDADWLDVVDATLAHFGAKVQAYEIWNEPNQQEFGDFDTPGVPARQQRYWELVKLTYPRIKAACPACVVLAGGSANGTPTGAASSSAAWLQAGYAQGAKNFFDAVADHPYYPNYGGPAAPSCSSPWQNPLGPIYQTDANGHCGELGALRDVMVAGGDSAKLIWGTEWGMPTSDLDRPDDPLAHVRNIQVDAVHLWRSVPWTGPLFLYTFQDAIRTGDCTTTPALGSCNFGVETHGADGSHQPKSPYFEDLRTALRGDFPDRLYWNQSLFENAALRSTDGRFFLWMQNDGNLVLYQAPSTVLWKLVDLHGSQLVNQADGTLQLLTRPNVPAWNSGSYQGPDHTTTLILQNDGNLVLYRDADGHPVWSSNTCCR